MIKITWNCAHDKFTSFFVIGDHESCWELAHTLIKVSRESISSYRPDNVKAWDLSGNEIPLDKGYPEYIAHRESTRV